MTGTLFVVATPIGNLEDITYRAVRILSEVDLIAAEDTRQTKILLNRYQINTPMTSYHKFNIRGKTSHLVETLKNGKNIALVSDSGTPGISDPGYEVVRGALIGGIRVEPIPGPSAVIAALSSAGLPTGRFLFLGFLPKKPGRKKKLLANIKSEEGSIVIYESPFRVLKTLADLLETLGDREVAVCREITKRFEEVIRGRISQVIAGLQRRAVKGEFVIVISGQDAQRESH